MRRISKVGVSSSAGSSATFSVACVRNMTGICYWRDISHDACVGDHDNVSDRLGKSLG